MHARILALRPAAVTFSGRISSAFSAHPSASSSLPSPCSAHALVSQGPDLSGHFAMFSSASSSASAHLPVWASRRAV
ncbi:MAG: hypothetical protein MPI95_07645 [Nitrosopumilus sp.]|nr:hypothetical protein [Nitrosopumilus sp.]MDA7942271.1 hypothetical protein [Nitrosopumilus sp.]MDA7944121.1 hypothetical protein [Nitrosopumilus sp.]MDA7945533.1 hypothetical protein [Nitrosopumilus sp.]MDA7953826.1 hypothetical protein [Nitrosopumilus sp.]